MRRQLMAAKELGEKIKEVRGLKGLSLAAVAGPAEMSPTYLQKLERGEVESPSPHRLYRLADVLDVSYTDLMQLAGYIVPSGTDSDAARERGNVLLQALSSDGGLTEDELADVAEFLAFRRQQAARRGG
jgi:HTH-type transcriptional regulator, competence development regulator